MAKVKKVGNVIHIWGTIEEYNDFYAQEIHTVTVSDCGNVKLKDCLSREACTCGDDYCAGYQFSSINGKSFIFNIVSSAQYQLLDTINSFNALTPDQVNSVLINYKPCRPIAVLNTSIITSDGTFTLQTISLDKAKELIKNNDILSAIGHQSTSEILTNLLSVSIPLNRIQFEQEQGQIALVFKLNGRPPEGKILSIEEIESIGYKFQLLTKL